MGRQELRTKSGLGQKILGLAIINIIPLAGFGYFAWALATGRASLDDLPAGLGRNAAYFGLAIALLIFFGSAMLPFCHGIAKGMRGRLRYSAEVRREAGFGRKLWEALLWLPRMLTYVIFYVLRALLYVASLALVLAALLFAIRFIKPDALEEQLQVNRKMETAVSWMREKVDEGF